MGARKTPDHLQPPGRPTWDCSANQIISIEFEPNFARNKCLDLQIYPSVFVIGGFGNSNEALFVIIFQKWRKYFLCQDQTIDRIDIKLCTIRYRVYSATWKWLYLFNSSNNLSVEQATHCCIDYTHNKSCCMYLPVHISILDGASWNTEKIIGSALITARINKHRPSKVWDENTYLFLNFNGYTVEVWECISNFIQHFIMAAIFIHAWIKVKPY